MSSSNQTLPPKEATLFKRILRCYEQKQFKAGLKYAKQILSNSKYADHGETLSMKGLTLSCLGRKEEAYEDARRGLRNDLKSHVCWHVYGLLQRSDRKYDEAIKCYRNALKLDQDNVQILRDLALLQIQMRDIEGYRETKARLLQLRPGHKPSWLGFCIAHDLLKEYDMAIPIVREYRRTQPNLSDYEASELALFENKLLCGSKQAKPALDHLKANQAVARDMLSFNEAKADQLIADGQKDKAAEVLAELINRNPEKWSYYAQLESCLSLETEEERLSIYTSVQEDHPRAVAPRRLPLNFVTGDLFKSLVEGYIQRGLRKGIPQLFNSLRALYCNPEKVAIIEEVTLRFVDGLTTNEKFSVTDTEMEPPSTLLWLLFFVGQHYDRLGKHEVALEYINKAIAHTPTLIELYMMKAKIYKHAGNMQQAAQFMDEARQMDTADRYVNCKAAKYMLRVNNVQKAEELCALFTREGSSSADSLTDMQCMWYLTEGARAYMRRDEWGEALKKCHEIDRHFDEFIEDQFDFHAYCLRRGTLRTYCKMLAVEDNIKSHKFFGLAAKAAIECYLHLVDHPVQDEEQKKDEATGGMDSKERKKELSKQRKAAKKRALQQQQQEAEQKKDSKAQQQQKDKEDREDRVGQKEKLDPKQLAKVEDPLEQAVKFLKPLHTFRSQDPATHLLAYQVYAKKRKTLLMLQALKRLSQVAPDHPQYHISLCDFVMTVKPTLSELSPAVQEVVKAGLTELTSDKDVEEISRSLLKAHSSSLIYRNACARILYRQDAGRQAECLGLVTSMEDSLSDRTVETCSAIFRDLQSGVYGDCSAKMTEYRGVCRGTFPLAVDFMSAEEVSQLTSEMEKMDLSSTVNGHGASAATENSL